MKKNIKKITLGSVLVSATIVTATATTSFAINASNQNNNNSAYESIYTQKNNVNLKNPLRKPSYQNNLSSQMTPYSTAIPKIKFNFLGFKEPSSPSAADGEVYYYIENYNANAMEWNESPSYETNQVGDIKNTGNYVTLYNLKAGINFMDGFGLKSGYTWSDGTSGIIWDTSPHMIFFNDNKSAKTTFTKAEKQPTTTTSTDGEVTYTLTNFDPNTMDIKLEPNANGTLGNYDPKTKKVKVTGLATNQYTQIIVSPKHETSLLRKKIPGYGVEDDNTSKTNMFNTSSAPEKSVTFALKNMNEIELNTDLKSQKSSTVDPEYADILKSSTARKHISEKFKFDNAKNKWTYNGANVETKAHAATWTLDSLTSSGNKSQSKLKVWVDSFNKSTGSVTIKSQLSLSINGGGEDNAAFTQLNLDFFSKSVHWNDRSTMPITSSKFTTSQSYVGLNKNLSSTYNVKQPTTKTSKDGEVTYTLTNFDPNKMVIAFAPGANGTLGKYDPKTKQIKITGLANGKFTQIQFTPKTNEKWTDGTATPLFSGTVTPAQTYVGLQKPTFTKAAVKQPTTKTSKDGEVTYTLTNFDPNKMVIALAPGANGTLGKYDQKTKQIKITGLANGKFTQIQVTPKTNEKWTDGTTSAQKSSNSVPSTVITKPTFTKVVKQPTTKTSKDGEVTYTLTNFDPNKMVIALAPGANGTLGKYDPITKQIKITGLSNGKITQIQITLKNQVDTWTDGTKSVQKSLKFTPSTVITKPTFTKVVKQPTTKTSKDGEVTYTLTNFDPNKMVIALAPGANGTLGKYDPITKQIKITGLANGEFTQIQVTLKIQGDTWTDGKTTAIVYKPTAITYPNDLPLVLIIPLSVLGALTIMFLIYSQRFYFSFKTMQKVTALNLRIFKTRIRLLGLKFTNALFKSK